MIQQGRGTRRSDNNDSTNNLWDVWSAIPHPVLPEATAFVQVQNSQHKIVVWSLQYCEFCWTLTRFLDRLGTPYERINIDNFKYAKDNMGNKYRAALQSQTDCKTFPLFFVGGKFIGGAVDACMMWKKNELQSLLAENGL